MANYSPITECKMIILLFIYFFFFSFSGECFNLLSSNLEGSNSSALEKSKTDWPLIFRPTYQIDGKTIAITYLK